MSGYRLKEIKDVGDVRFDFKNLRDTVLTKARDLPDRIGPVKLDVLEQIMESYLGLIPVVAQRMDAIEEHLEKGVAAGKPFIRSQERPDVGGSELQELTEGIRSLNDRLAKIESRLK